MKYISFLILLSCIFLSCNKGTYKNNYIQYGTVKLSSEEYLVLKKSLDGTYPRYDEDARMLTKKIEGYNYHTDAQSGVFHEIRGSFSYALGLLDLGDKQYQKRAFDIIEKTILLQDTVKSSLTCGVWPYYMEEPLATKKSPVDYNWADFNGVSLLDIYMDHQAEIPERLKPVIQKSIILAARSIQKRNVGPGYTNIAIMGTYVTYLTAHLFSIPDMKEYAEKRLKKFYDYTLQKGGFTEYNSPTYTLVALDELFRMKKHIIEPDSKQIIDSLYNIGWDIIARHYHKPSGQWAGPHSRSYSTLVRSSFYGILKQASGGKIDNGSDVEPGDVKIVHKIPAYLLPYFLTPVYPRTECDIFESAEPNVIGTTYLTDKYAFSSANRSSLWNQRRPFLIYWGSSTKPFYIQVRFLHDFYDFSSACFYSEQKENTLLAGINFITNGGDKHISIDRLKDGKFKAKDLRLRFEFGNCTNAENLDIPKVKDEMFLIKLDSLRFNFQLYMAIFEKYNGHWEKGSDGKTSWIDFVIYNGLEKEIDLTKIDQAILGFTFSVGKESEKLPVDKPAVAIKDKLMTAKWNNLNITLPIKPGLQPNNL